MTVVLGYSVLMVEVRVLGWRAGCMGEWEIKPERWSGGMVELHGVIPNPPDVGFVGFL